MRATHDEILRTKYLGLSSFELMLAFEYMTTNAVIPRGEPDQRIMMTLVSRAVIEDLRFGTGLF